MSEIGYNPHEHWSFLAVFEKLHPKLEKLQSYKVIAVKGQRTNSLNLTTDGPDAADGKESRTTLCVLCVLWLNSESPDNSNKRCHHRGTEATERGGTMAGRGVERGSGWSVGAVGAWSGESVHGRK